MKILNKVSLKNLKLNKKRTISMIIGIILSVALICAACTLGTSFQATLVANVENDTGYYHLYLENINNQDVLSIKNNRKVKNVTTAMQEGYGFLEGIKNEGKPYAKLYSMDRNAFEFLKFKLINGRFANNQNEVVISNHINTNGGLKYKIGDSISLSVGKRKTLDNYDLSFANPYNKEDEKLVDTEKRNFTIVGIIERPSNSFENFSDPGYTIITTNDKSEKANIEAYIALTNPKEYETAIPEILGAKNMEEVKSNTSNAIKYDNYSLNTELLRWEALAFSDTTVSMLYSVIGVVVAIILFTSVFCIRNSFAISTTEKIKMYGMFSSIGATKKQIKKSVVFEALILGLIGIPIGILSGIFAVWVLISIVNQLLAGHLFANVEGIILNVSIAPIILSIVLGFLTVYLSAISSARKASKVSPIEQLRNSQDIKVNAKKLKVPKIISKVFKMGGVLAYKNLKRSKKKYRTTVISLAVSICVFITMNAFLTNAFGLSDKYYEDYDYNVILRPVNPKTITKEKIEELASVNNKKESYVLYESGEIRITDLSKLKNPALAENMILDEQTNTFVQNKEKFINLHVLALDSKSFEKYAKKVGTNYNEVKKNGILCDTYDTYNQDGTINETRTYKYKKGDNIIGTYKEEEISIGVGKVTDILPYGAEYYRSQEGYLILNCEEHPELNSTLRCITYETDKPEQLEKEIQKIKTDVNVINIDEQAKEERSMVLIIKIFLYGFITVITLIGVTNIFNTITSNMELRQKEFAMLKSIGMTKREFNRMINFETLLYGTKSLIYGVILGLIGTFALYQAFSLKISSDMYIPVNPILLSAVFVFVLVFIIMKYSVGKINKQNTIETIRRENI